MCLFWIKIYSKTPLKYYSLDSKGAFVFVIQFLNQIVLQIELQI